MAEIAHEKRVTDVDQQRGLSQCPISQLVKELLVRAAILVIANGCCDSIR